LINATAARRQEGSQADIHSSDIPSIDGHRLLAGPDPLECIMASGHASRTAPAMGCQNPQAILWVGFS
jgi:hypothetical protein